ncbi:MAG: hypothetical protein ACLR1T_12840 [Evtepia gabavorous]
MVFWFSAIPPFFLSFWGIVGLIQASKAKELGYQDAIRTAGFVLSLIGLIGGALTLCGLCRLRQLCGDRQHPSPVIPSTHAAAFLPRRLHLEFSLRLCYPIGILAALSSPRTAC